MRLRTGVPAALLLVLSASVSAQAILYVDVDSTAPVPDGSSWPNAFPSLQGALAVAVAGDEIWVAEGTYTPGEARSSSFSLVEGVEIYGGFNGAGAARDPVVHPTILSGDIGVAGDDSDNAYQVVTATGVSLATRLDGFTITAGNANGTTEISGGGLTCSNASPTIIDCRFSGNRADGFGGAIHNSNSSPSFLRCVIEDSSAAFGGGVRNLNGSDASYTNCAFLRNEATTDGGGVIDDASGPHYLNCTFQGNQSPGAGALLVDNSTTLLTNCLIWDNSSSLGISGAPPGFAHSLVAGWTKATLDGLPDSSPTNLDPADPLFVDAAGGDLRLTWGSPAVDAGDGSANSTTTDLAGAARKVGPIDLGAFEFQGNLHVDAMATGNDDGTDWANAFTDLQSALAVATPGDQVWVAAGTYRPTEGGDRSASFDLPTGVRLYGGFAGTETDPDQRLPGAHESVLSGDIGVVGERLDNAYHVVTAVGDDGVTTRIDGFTIADAQADGGPGDGSGGGLLTRVDLEVAGCRFINNTAGAGGAILGQRSALTITDTAFVGNLAATDSGGGIYYVTEQSGATTLSATACSFSRNQADVFGAAIFCTGVLDTTPEGPFLSNCSFLENEADIGILSTVITSPVVVNCLFAGNVTGQNGIIGTSRSGGSFVNCTVAGNTTSLGTMFSNSDASPSFTNCLVWGNLRLFATDPTSPDGSVQNSGDSSPTFANCLIEFSGGSGSWAPSIGVDNGNNLDADPRFAVPPCPDGVPNALGDFRLVTGSPAIDAGDNGANSTSVDLAGDARIQGGTIDIGAHEGSLANSFAGLFGSLDRQADANANGIPNYLEYALGGNPLGPNDTSLLPAATPSEVTFSYRDASDVEVEFQMSPDLGGWTVMEEGGDYIVNSTVSKGLRTIITLDLLADPELTESFFRQEFPEGTP